MRLETQILKPFSENSGKVFFLEYIKLKTDEFLCAVEHIKDSLKGISSLPS
jgi:hypothetical protein